MTDEQKHSLEWIRVLASGEGFLSYMVGQQAEAEKAADLFEQMATENDDLSKCRHNCKIVCLLDRYERAKRERDAAVRDLGDVAKGAPWRCYLCKHSQEALDARPERCPYAEVDTRCKWEWRGVCDKNSNVDDG